MLKTRMFQLFNFSLLNYTSFLHPSCGYSVPFFRKVSRVQSLSYFNLGIKERVVDHSKYEHNGEKCLQEETGFISVLVLFHPPIFQYSGKTCIIIIFLFITPHL